jgi:hypothetical protein
MSIVDTKRSVLIFDKFHIVRQDKSQFHIPFVEFRSPNLLQGFGLPFKVRVEGIRISGKQKKFFIREVYPRSAIDKRLYVLYI